MSRWRHQVPVRSPLSAAALLAGARAAAGNGRSEAALTDLTALLRARYAPTSLLLTDSGTSALRTALVETLRERELAVALPAFCCYDLATVANGADVPVVLYDLDPHTLTPDLDSLRGALRLKVGAVVVVHFYGYPVDLAEVNRLAAETGAVVIEDAAQGAGATLHGRPVGTQSSLGVLSFGRGKGMTGGSGGALLANDAAGARLLEGARELLGGALRGWSDVAAVAAQMVLERPALYALPAALPFLHLGETIYRAPHEPRGATPASCAVVAATWRLADEEVQVRRSNAARLMATLSHVAGKERDFQPVCSVADARPGYLRLAVLASLERRRAAAGRDARRLGVSPSYPAVLSEVRELVRRCVNRDAVFPGARALATRLLTLPTHGRLGSEDLSRLEHWLGGP